MLTIEEITLVKLYSGFTPNRESALNEIKKTIDFYTENEFEEKDFCLKAIKKLEAMTNSDFEEINFSLAIED